MARHNNLRLTNATNLHLFNGFSFKIWQVATSR